MKKKIIFLSNGYRGGAVSFIEQHINYLCKKRSEIFLIDDNPNKTYVHFKNLKKINKIKSSIFKEKSKTKIIIKNIVKNRPENIIFFTTNYFIYLYYYFFFKKYQNSKAKFVLTLHSGLISINFRNFFAVIFFSLIAKKIDLLFYGSLAAKKWWIIRFPWMKKIKTKIIHNGIDRKKFKKRKISKIINVSFIGRIEKENNPELFIEVAKKMKNKDNDYRFHMFGDGSELKNIKKNFVKIHGWKNKSFIFKTTDILLITSKFTNFPYVALEAKSNSIPIISCSRGDMKKLIRNSIDGFITKKTDCNNLIKLIIKIKSKYNYFSYNSYLDSLKFDTNNSCKNFWSIIEVENNNFR